MKLITGFRLQVLGCSLLLLAALAAPKSVEAVSIDGEGGVHATYGESWISSWPNGEHHGNYTPGQNISGTWAAFHCTNRGTAPCATDLTPAEATKIGGGNYTVVVATQGQRTYVGRHNFSSQQCGRIQYDIGTNNDGTIGGWVYDFGVNCGGGGGGGVTPTPIANTCQQWQPVNTEFRRYSGSDAAWMSGSAMGTLRVGEAIDVNCFAQNGAALLPEAEMRIQTPAGQGVRSGAELRNYRLDHVGTYTFVCRSRTLQPVCENSDAVRVQVSQPSVTPVPTVTTRPTATPTPRPPVGGPVHQASCNELRILSGNQALAPATVTVETLASDNLGSIRKYRYHWGDGVVVEGSQRAEHRYETGGTYQAWVEILDSQGNWRTSPGCQKTVTLQTSPIASHQSYCSEVVIVSGNDRQAPSEVVFDVNGYDNKGAIQGYKLELGNGVTLENSSGEFRYWYNTPGTYIVKGYIKNSSGTWVGGESGCVKSVRVLTKPITQQPSTGAPVAVLGLTSLSGLGGVGLMGMRRFLI